jgi:hypothetical protein
MLSPIAFNNPQPIFFNETILATLGLMIDFDRTTGFAAPMQAFADDDADDEDEDGDDEEDGDDLDEDDEDEDDEEDDAEDDTDEDDAEDNEETA